MRAAILLLVLSACSSHLAVGPLPVHPDRELAILRSGASQPGAEQLTIDQRDFVLALRVCDLGLLRHPSKQLRDLRGAR